MIEIRLVKVVRNGVEMLVGERYQDRWNLETLGYTSIPYTRNGNAIKSMRRANPDFTFTTVRNGQVADITPTEMDMMSRGFRVAATAMAMLMRVAS